MFGPPFAASVVSRPLGWTYDIDPWSGKPAPTMAAATFVRGQLVQRYTVVRQLPWTPYSYPGVGREPGQFPENDEVFQPPAFEANHAKARLGR